ncbi:hypothetical protein Pla22_21260 [Rubripirellula amarantea]|uniref:Uncharacterized protein n=1 Tax=Rubripirellula amarantea TaxID=2527999 RepID=A0A5C5WW93_9BACT|nr:hypothetical protein [Rubripirellula amarantea]TWT54479.1 hypothetical protein Pla22_21260 [Rubripirellula amarantea]
MKLLNSALILPIALLVFGFPKASTVAEENHDLTTNQELVSILEASMAGQLAISPIDVFVTTEASEEWPNSFAFGETRKVRVQFDQLAALFHFASEQKKTSDGQNEVAIYGQNVSRDAVSTISGFGLTSQLTETANFDSGLMLSDVATPDLWTYREFPPSIGGRKRWRELKARLLSEDTVCNVSPLENENAIRLTAKIYYRKDSYALFHWLVDSSDYRVRSVQSLESIHGLKAVLRWETEVNYVADANEPRIESILMTNILVRPTEIPGKGELGERTTESHFHWMTSKPNAHVKPLRWDSLHDVVLFLREAEKKSDSSSP